MFRFALGSAAAIILFLGTASISLAAENASSEVTDALAHPARPPIDRALDQLKQPDQIISFAQIKSSSTVADLVPGNGYYTRIFSALIGPEYHVYSVVPFSGGAEPGEVRRAAGNNPVDAVLDLQNITGYGNVMVLWQDLAQHGGQFSVPEQLDIVFSSDAYHDLRAGTYGALDMAAVNKAIFFSLRPGGYLVVVDNAAKQGAAFNDAKTLGRVDKDALKAELLAAGFTLDGESNVLANPADDHTKAATDSSLGGKPDRFAMRFRRPGSGTNRFAAKYSGENLIPTDSRPKDDPLRDVYDNTLILNAGAPDQRYRFYHDDKTFQEYGAGNVPAREGVWYWDALGRNCMVRQSPAAERGFTQCSDFKPKAVGESWSEGGTTQRLEEGLVYP